MAHKNDEQRLTESEVSQADTSGKQAETDLHKKKRGKNLALLALILGWVLLIWLITMVRVSQAHAQDSAGMFYNQRTNHEEAIVSARETIDDGRVAHQETIAPRPAQWWQGWQDRLFPADYKAPEAENVEQAQSEAPDGLE